MKLKISKIFNYCFPFIDFVYILQLEEYELTHYLSWISSRWWKRNFQKVGTVDWTVKARAIIFITLALYASLLLLIFMSESNVYNKITGFVIFTIAIPIIVAITRLIIYPFDLIIKKWVIAKAKSKLISLPDCSVVTIAGSYGKTSTRGFLTQLLRHDYKIHTPAGNINTTFGIAQDVLKNLSRDTQIYLVELGEYFPKDFSRFFSFLPKPKVAILTSVGPQHLSSFGSQKKVDKEFSDYLQFTTDSKQFVNRDNPGNRRVLANYGGEVSFYAEGDLANLLDGNDYPEVLNIKHFREDVAGAIMACRFLGLDLGTIKNRLVKLETTDRRMNLNKVNDILILDDSYNINPDSAEAALSYVSDLKNKRVIVVTGGLVEQGSQEIEANIKYGHKLGSVADVIIVADNIFRKHICRGIKKSKDHPRVIISKSPKKTPIIIRRIVRANDVVLVQNELPDLYWS